MHEDSSASWGEPLGLALEPGTQVAGYTLEALLAGEKLPVFVEFDPTDFIPGRATLTLTGTGGRVLTLSNVVFP